MLQYLVWSRAEALLFLFFYLRGIFIVVPFSPSFNTIRKGLHYIHFVVYTWPKAAHIPT